MNDELRRGRKRRRYAQVPEDLLFDGSISPEAKTVWGILDRHIDNRSESATEGCAFPGRARLAEMLGKSLSSVDRAIAELKRIGWLATQRRGQGRTNVYLLFDEPEPPESSPVTTLDSSPVTTLDPSPVTTLEPPSVTTPKRNGPVVIGPKGPPPTPRKRGADGRRPQPRRAPDRYPPYSATQPRPHVPDGPTPPATLAEAAARARELRDRSRRPDDGDGKVLSCN